MTENDRMLAQAISFDGVEESRDFGMIGKDFEDVELGIAWDIILTAISNMETLLDKKGFNA